MPILAIIYKKRENMEDKLVVIDGNSLVFRAFYGLPPLSNKDGEPCGAIYGFCKMLINVIEKLQPKYMVIAFDAGKHPFRHDIFAEYKGTRKPMPDELRMQLAPLKSLLVEMGIKVVEMADIEADDLIGSTVKKFACNAIVVSGDRDLLQLVNDKTTVWLTQKGISDIWEANEITLKEKYGIAPYQVIEMKSIMGDTSDNIPGVKGIGEKTAKKLLDEYTTLDGIYAHLDEIKGKTHDLLSEQKDMAYVSRTLATIKTDVELDYNIDDCTYDFPFNSTVLDIMKRYEFNTIVNRKELFSSNEEVQICTHNNAKQMLETVEDFDSLVKEIKDKKSFAMYLTLNTVNFALQDTEYILDNMMFVNMSILESLKYLLQDCSIEKVLFDSKENKHYFQKLNIDINNYFDISLAVYLVNESEGLLKYEEIENNKGLDTDLPSCNLLSLKEELSKTLKERQQWNLYQDIELKLVEVLYEMELAGIKINVDEISVLSEKYKQEADELEKKIFALAGSEFNIKSPKQLMKVLFEDLKLVYKGKKSTNVEVLESVKNQHEIVDCILRYRKIAKLVSTYLDGMLPYIDNQSKIHTTFMQSFTSTGRLSSREPNLQNIPVRDEESKALRKLFVSSFEGGSIMSADYNQIELRLMAIFSKDDNLLQDFNNKVDVHSMTASKIFDVLPEEVTPQQRRVAKAVNFGIIYGISEYGLSKNINSTPKQAKEFIEKYFYHYPTIKTYMEQSIEFAKQNGYCKTYFNRIRHIPEIKSTNYTIRQFGERVALNMPLQGTASDIIKLAMIKVQNSIKSNNLKSKLILQIHDELIIDVFPGEEDVCKQILKDNMMSVVDFALPLEVSISCGKTWFDAK